MTEKIQIGGGRIDIANLEKATEKVNEAPFNAGQIITEKSSVYPLIRSYPDVKDPEDITGGYILTIEKKHDSHAQKDGRERPADPVPLQGRRAVCFGLPDRKRLGIAGTGEGYS